MGEVYAAQHLGQGRRLALKILSDRFAGAEDRARFLREGQLAASIHHPNSVYVFGSEEIAGAPVISMELLPGGTLKDRVEHAGPMRPASAVDAILQVIAGLDAAHAAGILHRDVKPSNCFTDGDGMVKIGDFGLSIGTLAREVPALSLTGTFQGTPQYASPEQLRGEPLDVRGDIYSVGATLYYLLTGEPPFDHRSLMGLLSRIAREQPRSPRALQRAIPAELARLVSRCLAKDRADRPASYVQLTDLLRPFCSAAATPAPAGPRLAAGAFDLAVVAGISALGTLVGLVLDWNPASWSVYRTLVAVAFVFYWGISEGTWGAAYGKWACGLRVVASSGQRPGIVRGLVRSLVFVLPSMAFTVLAQSWLRVDWVGLWFMPVAGAALTISLMFLSTARPRNGLAGLHEIISGTRTVLRRPSKHQPAGTALPRHDSNRSVTRRVGPYEVLAPLGSTDAGELHLARDPRLRRLVWVHLLHGNPSVPEVCDVSRPGRLRWLNGQRLARSGWDAYEATEGAPLSVVTFLQVQPWKIVRQWLLDLAEEIGAGVKDGTVTSLSLERIWISDGHARVLDFRAPDAPVGRNPVPATSVTTQIFLHDLAIRAVGALQLARLPLSATACLQALKRAEFTNLEQVVTELKNLMTRPDRVTQRQRSMALALAVLASIVGGIALRKLLGPALPALLNGTVVSPLDPSALAAVSRYAGDLGYALLGIGCASALRGGLWLRAFGIAVVTRDGKEISRVRAAGRALLVWGWVPVQLVAVVQGWFAVALLILMLKLVGLAWAADHPERGLHDRFVDTYLVPR